MLNDEIGKRIKQRRADIGLSAQQLADRLDFSKATIYRYESGEIKAIKLPVIQKIADALNCDPAYLLGKTDDPHIKPANDADPRDVQNLFNDLIQKLLADRDLNFNGVPLSPSDRLILVNNLEATVDLFYKKSKT